MKKFIFVIPLMAISLLTNCGGGNKPEELKFSVSSSEALVDIFTYKTSVELDWTPTEHSIEFSDFAFILSKQTTIIPTIEAVDITARPLTLNLTFNNEFNMDDKGKLKFHYNDKTTKKEGDWETEDINIKLNPYQVREEEFNDACDFKGITRMQGESSERIIIAGGTIATRVFHSETSELICHTVEQIDENYGDISVTEEYARKDAVDSNHCELTEKEDEEEWSTPRISYELGDYPFTGHYYNPLKLPIGTWEPSLEYSNFEFIDNKYVYEGRHVGFEMSAKIELKFENKILINSKKRTEDDTNISEGEFVYSFEDILPTWPLPE